MSSITSQQFTYVQWIFLSTYHDQPSSYKNVHLMCKSQWKILLSLIIQLTPGYKQIMQYIWHSNVINIKSRILWVATSELFSFRSTLHLWLLCKLKMDATGSPNIVTPIYQTIYHIPRDCFYHVTSRGGQVPPRNVEPVEHWLYIPGWHLTSS